MTKRFHELSMVVGERDEQQPHTEGGGDAELGADRPVATVTDTIPTLVDLNEIRQCYPRKPDAMGNPRQGTRITFLSGAGCAVTEDYATVKALLMPTQH